MGAPPPFDYALQSIPVGQDRPFDKALQSIPVGQDRPFGYAQDRSAGFAWALATLAQRVDFPEYQSAECQSAETRERKEPPPTLENRGCGYD